jgi:hypothetical protein
MRSNEVRLNLPIRRHTANFVQSQVYNLSPPSDPDAFAWEGTLLDGMDCSPSTSDVKRATLLIAKTSVASSIRKNYKDRLLLVSLLAPRRIKRVFDLPHSSGLALLRGETLNHQDLERVILADWHDRLGPDLFPRVKPTLLSTGRPATKNRRIRTADGVRRFSHAAASSKAKKCAPAGEPRLSWSPPSRTSPVATTPVQTLPPSWSYSQSTTIESRSTMTPLTAPSLSSFLSSFAPTHDFTSSASVLVASGLSCLEALLDMLEAEQATYETAVDLLIEQGKLQENEGKWVKYALGEARREYTESV